MTGGRERVRQDDDRVEPGWLDGAEFVEVQLLCTLLCGLAV